MDDFWFGWVRPRAAEIDADLGALRGAFGEMARRGVLGFRIPEEYGGLGFDDAAFRRFQETAARCSGALAFLETQHQSGCAFLVRSDTEPLKRDLLPRLATGERTSAIAFSA